MLRDFSAPAYTLDDTYVADNVPDQDKGKKCQACGHERQEMKTHIYCWGELAIKALLGQFAEEPQATPEVIEKRYRRGELVQRIKASKKNELAPWVVELDANELAEIKWCFERHWATNLMVPFRTIINTDYVPKPKDGPVDAPSGKPWREGEAPRRMS